jgi:hypothetical protein
VTFTFIGKEGTLGTFAEQFLPASTRIDALTSGWWFEHLRTATLERLKRCMRPPIKIAVAGWIEVSTAESLRIEH